MQDQRDSRSDRDAITERIRATGAEVERGTPMPKPLHPVSHRMVDDAIDAVVRSTGMVDKCRDRADAARRFSAEAKERLAIATDRLWRVLT